MAETRSRKARRFRWSWVIVATILLLLVGFGWFIIETRALLTAQPNPVHDYHTPIVERMRAVAGERDIAASEDEWQRFIATLETSSAIVSAAHQEVRAALQNGDAQPRWRSDEGLSFAYILFGSPPPADIDRELEVIERLQQAQVLEQLRQLAAEAPAIEPCTIGAPLMERMSSFYGAARELAKVRVAMMRLAAANGNGADAAQAFDEVMALGQTAGSQLGLISALVGVSVQYLALVELQYELNEMEFDAGSCRRLLRTFDRRMLPPFELALQGERAMSMDMVQWYFSDDGEGNGYLLPKYVFGFSSREDGGLFGSSAGGGGVGFAEAFRSRWRFANRAETVSEFTRLFDQVIAEAAKPRTERSPAILDWQAAGDLSERLVVVDAMAPALSHALSGRERFQLEYEATRIMVAIELYGAIHGEYPQSLEELLPDLLETLPLDPLSGDEFGYRLLDKPDGYGRKYLLYSFGLDAIDNQAKEFIAPNYVDEHAATAALADDTMQGIDYIFNRPRRTIHEVGW